MSELDAIRSSVGNITAILGCCAVIFGILIFRLLPKIISTAYDSADAETPKEQDLITVKMIGLMMVVPVVAFLAVIVGEFSTLWYASPLWCCYMGSLILALGALIFSLFWLDRDDVEDYTFELDRRAAIDKRINKQDAEKKIVLIGFGLWIAGLGASYVWLLHLARLSLRDVLHWI
jgi:hypothetical protein